ncbi:hypothetical protein BB561_006966, partial [Smittium simulii]
DILQEPQKERDLDNNTGTIVWDGSYILSKFIHKSLYIRGYNCIELGAGCGLVSIVCKIKGAKIIATDMKEAVELTNKNIENNLQNLNIENYGTNNCEIQTRSLEWGSELDLEKFPKFDFIFGSEILYLKQTHSHLLKTIKHLSHPNTKIFILYYPRGLGEEFFIKKAKAQGFTINEFEIDDPEFVASIRKYRFIEMEFKGVTSSYSFLMSSSELQKLTKRNPSLKPWDIEDIISKFNSLDLDSNGGLDQRDLVKAVDKIQPGVNYDDIRGALKDIEVSRPGVVELDEFVEVSTGYFIFFLIASIKSSNGSSLKAPAVIEGIQTDRSLKRRTIITSKQNISSAHTINEDEKEEFTNHINYVLGSDNDIGHRFPIEPTTMQIFDECRDGLILSKLINYSVPDTIDERVLNRGRKLSPFQITENNNVVVNSAKAIGCSVVNIGSQDLAEGREHLILGLIWQIIKIGLFSNIDIKLHPELYRLLEDGESLDDFLRLPADAILLRWFNYHLKAAGWHRKVSNFSGDIKDSENYLVLLSQLVPEKCNRQALSEPDLHQRAELMLMNADAIGCRRYLSHKTVVNGNPKLNLAFVALLFNTYPCLQALEEDDDHAELDEFLFKDQYDRESRAFALWLNSLNVHPFVNYLFEDIKDGRVLLQAFDKIFPSTIINRRVNSQDNLSRFKQIENTNYAVELGKQRNFSLVGIQGADITDGNPVLVLAIVWQLMRANIIQTLQSLSAGGREVTDAYMIQWANETANKHHPRFSGASIRSFSDSNLKSGLFLLDVLEGLKPGIVDPSLVAKSPNEESYKLNSKYAISISRKLGATIFLLPEDIVEIKPKMILTFIGSLMAI